MRDNAICSLLNIRYPILVGGMTWVSEAVLAAAVSEAGALGTIATGNMPGEPVCGDPHPHTALYDR